jgi:hypothetical protein
MADVTLLIALPGILTSRHLESRNEPDTSDFEFVVSNVTTSLVKLTNVQLTLAFDFSSKNLMINGKLKSIPGASDAVVIDVDDLLPGVPTTVTLTIDANANGTPSPATSYQLAVLATYDTEPWPEIVEPVNIGGGVQVFFVVPD